MAEKKGFILYLDQYKPISKMTLEQKGMLFDAIYLYNLGEEHEISDPVVAMAFGFFQAGFEREKEKYEQICITKKNAVNSRWANQKNKEKEQQDVENDTGVGSVLNSDTNDTHVSSEIHNHTNDTHVSSEIQTIPYLEQDLEQDQENIKSIKACTEPETVSAQQQAQAEISQDILLSENQEPPDPCVIEIPIHGDPKIKTHKVFASDIAQYRELYPAVDVEQELRNMLGWCTANPTRQKTRSGIKRFIASWLARAQNQAGNHTRASPQVQPKSWQQIQEDELQKALDEARKRDEARARGEAV